MLFVADFPPVAPEFHRRTFHVRLRNLGTTDKNLLTKSGTGRFRENIEELLEERLKMKVVILAGGFGTRIDEESHLKPKPMIEIGEKPILWHIMKYYSEFGYHDFVICLGYKQYVVKNFCRLLPAYIRRYLTWQITAWKYTTTILSHGRSHW